MASAKLNLKQEQFIINLLNGMSQREAYKNAYKVNYKAETIDSNACKLFNSDKVQSRYKELKEKMLDDKIMTAKERMQFLTKIVNGEEKEEIVITIDAETGEVVTKKIPSKLDVKIKALDTLNKMSGEYKSILSGKVELSYEETLKSVGDIDEY